MNISPKTGTSPLLPSPGAHPVVLGEIAQGELLGRLTFISPEPGGPPGPPWTPGQGGAAACPGAVQFPSCTATSRAPGAPGRRELRRLGWETSAALLRGFQPHKGPRPSSSLTTEPPAGRGATCCSSSGELAGPGSAPGQCLRVRWRQPPQAGPGLGVCVLLGWCCAGWMLAF